MSFEVPSLPPSMIPQCDPSLSGAPGPKEAIRSFIDPGLSGFWRSLEQQGSATEAAVRPSNRGIVSWCVKRASDYAIAMITLAFAWPFMLLIALLIRVDSEGPVLFRQQRIGYLGRPFEVLKFRTMSLDAEQRLKDLEHLNESDGGVLFKIKRDPRVTRFGQFLRRSSLDELPQLINVLRGEMSVVGPRPLQLRDSASLGKVAPAGFARRLDVLPGLTGPWQVSGRSEVGFERMLELDLDYIEHGTLWTDFRIFWRTVMIVLLGRGAY
jgi:lipopolysaccharide/colanic/teichoic acid biosynthesis glycosyltransferase